MSRTCAAIAPSSSPDSATILALALFSCSSAGSGAGAAPLPWPLGHGRVHVPPVGPVLERLAADRPHEADRRLLRREALNYTRTALYFSIVALLHVIRPDAAAARLREVEVGDDVSLGPRHLYRR